MKLTLTPADGRDETPYLVEICDDPRLDSEVLIGRAGNCDIQILQASVSRHHCAIVLKTTAETLCVRDLRSRNGTFVNQRPVAGLCEIRDGDLLTVGALPLKVEISGSSSVWDRVATRSRAAQLAEPRPMSYGKLAKEQSNSREQAEEARPVIRESGVLPTRRSGRGSFPQ